MLDIKKFPSQIEEISENAFEKCMFTEIALPESMKVVHKKSFNCLNLEKVTNYSQSFDNKDGFSTESFEECSHGLDFFKIES